MIALSPYAPAQAADLLAIWQAAFGDHYPITADLWRSHIEGDPSFRPDDLLVAQDAGVPVGFALGKLWRGDYPGCDRFANAGYVGLLAVAPERQGQGIGSRLLGAVEQHLRQAGAQEIWLGGSFHHVMPGVPEAAERAWRFCESRGYESRQVVYDVRRRLDAGPPLPELAPLPAPFAIRPYRQGEQEALLHFLNQAFAGRWPRDVAWFLAQGGAIETIMGAFAGDEPVGFACLHPSGSVGALRWAGFNPAIGALGPIGVAGDKRGHGLGLALLVRGIEHLRTLGVTDMVIDWTDLLDFYGRCGFAPWLRYTRARKVLA